MKVIVKYAIIKKNLKKWGLLMELLQLRYFCDTAKSLNISKTARKYTVPPSNVSQSIKRLEKELGYPLFIRRANKISLNDPGKTFYKKVSKALSLIDDAAADRIDDGTKGSISISINSNRRIVMETIEQFKKQYPGVNIKTAYFGNLDEEEYNFVIDCQNASLKGYRREILCSEEIALAVNSENPLAKAEKINVSELSGEPFITMDAKASMYKVTKDICRKNGFEPKIALQSDDPAFIRKCVELGLGIAFAPTLSWKGQFPENVILKPLDFRRDISVYINEKAHLPLCARNFLSALLEHIKAI